MYIDNKPQISQNFIIKIKNNQYKTVTLFHLQPVPM